MKILVIGGSGFLGYNIVKHLQSKQHDVTFTYNKNSIPEMDGVKLNITKKEDIINLIKILKPDLLIHTPSVSSVDLCETDHKIADLINVEGIKNIIQGCIDYSCKLVYISTTYVFDGKKNKFTEEDLPTPGNYYGHTKLLAENLIKNSGLPYLILRTDQPYYWAETWHHTNSVLRVLDYLKAKKDLNEIVDWYNVPTYVPDFTTALEFLINKKKTGIFHVTGPDFINRYDWSLLVAKIFKLDSFFIHSINSSSLNLPAKRCNIHVDNQKLFRETGIKMRSLEESLIDMYSNSQ